MYGSTYLQYRGPYKRIFHKFHVLHVRYQAHSPNAQFLTSNHVPNHTGRETGPYFPFGNPARGYHVCQHQLLWAQTRVWHMPLALRNHAHTYTGGCPISVYVPNHMSRVHYNITIHVIKHRCGSCVPIIGWKPQPMCRMCVRISFPVPEDRSTLCVWNSGDKHMPARKGVPPASKFRIPYRERVSTSQLIYPNTCTALVTILSENKLPLCLACVPISAFIQATTCLQCLFSSYVPHAHDGSVCLRVIAKHKSTAYASLSRFLLSTTCLAYVFKIDYMHPAPCLQCFSTFYVSKHITGVSVQHCGKEAQVPNICFSISFSVFNHMFGICTRITFENPTACVQSFSSFHISNHMTGVFPAWLE